MKIKTLAGLLLLVIVFLLGSHYAEPAKAQVGTNNGWVPYLSLVHLDDGGSGGRVGDEHRRVQGSGEPLARTCVHGSGSRGRSTVSFARLAFALFAAAPLATTAAATMAPQDSVVEAELREESEAWIELRLDPLADMVLEAAFATQPPSRFSAPPPLKIENEPGLESLQDGRAALAAARRLHAILPHPLAWGVVFSRLEGCEDAFEWAEKLEALPEITEFFGQEFSIRDEALEFADALSVIEDEFRSALWPARGLQSHR